MSEHSLLTLYTAPPSEERHPYQKPPYRNIFGLRWRDSALWIPGADPRCQPEEYDLGDDFARGIVAFFKQRFIDHPRPGNCHIAAAGMRQLPNWEDEPTARGYALDIWRDGQRGERALGVWEQGVYAGLRLDHSVLGFVDGQHIQQDGTDGRDLMPLSILPAASNDEYYLNLRFVDFYTAS